MRKLIFTSWFAYALGILMVPAHGQTVCDATNTSCKVMHNDMAALTAAIKALNLSSATTPATTATTTTTAPTATVSTADQLTATYFPTDPGVALFPSPENSRIVRLNGVISGRPYLLAKDGSIHQLVPSTGANGHAYTVNGALAGGGGSGLDTYNQLLERQGQVFAQLAGGQWQQFNPGMGSMYNASLPDAFATNAAGVTTSTVATSSVTAPTASARMSPAPGTSGKTLTICASGCGYTTVTDAIKAAQAGDTVDIQAGVYKETPPAWTVPLKIVFESGASIDVTGMTTLARGKGALVPAADSVIVNPVITGAGMTETQAGGTAAIRPDSGCGYLDIQGGTLTANQNGIAGGDVPVVLTVTGTNLVHNGLGDGYTHDMYMSAGTISVTLTNVTALTPNGGHAIKSRAFNTAIKGGSFAATDATAIDIPNGSVGVMTIDGATITKPAGSNNHGVIGYASENANSGLGGMLITNTTIDSECDNPFIQAGNSSVITLGTGVVLKGNKPTADGTVKGL